MNIDYVITVVVLVVGLVIAMGLLQRVSGGEVCYESRGGLFTPAERSFLSVLEQALDCRYRVFAKVRLGDLIMARSGQGRPRRSVGARPCPGPDRRASWRRPCSTA